MSRAHERMSDDWRDQRLLLTAAIGAATAVLLQSSFNVELLGINVALWAMAAVVSVVALGAGVTVGLSPRAILHVDEPDRAVTLEPPRRPHRRPARRASIAVPAIVAGVAVVALSWFASTWWRADRSYLLAIEGTNTLVGVTQPTESPDQADSAEQAEVLRSTLAAFGDARSQNTIEAIYPLSEAQFEVAVLDAANAVTTENAAGLQPLRDLLQNAVDRAPRNPVPLSTYGVLLAAGPRAGPGPRGCRPRGRAVRASLPGQPIQRHLFQGRGRRPAGRRRCRRRPRGRRRRPRAVPGGSGPAHVRRGHRRGSGRRDGKSPVPGAFGRSVPGLTWSRSAASVAPVTGKRDCKRSDLR